MKAYTFTKFHCSSLLRCISLTNFPSGSPHFIHLHQTRPSSTRQAKHVQTKIVARKPLSLKTVPRYQKHSAPENVSSVKNSQDGYSRPLIVGAVSLGAMLLLMGMDSHEKALAFGPEGPLVEEFWDNVRRYGLYALTVSTGALYAILQPIFELLKNPISAVLVLVIIGGSFFILSQVVSAMVGVTDFSYEYAY